MVYPIFLAHIVHGFVQNNPLMDIVDLSKEESIAYLTKKRNINEVEAKNYIYDWWLHYRIKGCG